jgi:uncharacterized BrkB/YihY/UPF0761 family membrane protein
VSATTATAAAAAAAAMTSVCWHPSSVKQALNFVYDSMKGCKPLPDSFVYQAMLLHSFVLVLLVDIMITSLSSCIGSQTQVSVVNAPQTTNSCTALPPSMLAALAEACMSIRLVSFTMVSARCICLAICLKICVIAQCSLRVCSCQSHRFGTTQLSLCIGGIERCP